MKDLILMGVKVGTYEHMETARQLMAFSHVEPIPELVGLLPHGTVVFDFVNGTVFGDDMVKRNASVLLTCICGRSILQDGIEQDFITMVDENPVVNSWVDTGRR